jgi:hypothetical protein
MSRLNRELVEYRLPIKSGFRPYKQPTPMFDLVIHDWAKEEVGWLLDTGFICPCRYLEWVSIIVPIEKRTSTKSRYVLISVI